MMKVSAYKPEKECLAFSVRYGRHQTLRSINGTPFALQVTDKLMINHRKSNKQILH